MGRRCWGTKAHLAGAIRVRHADHFIHLLVRQALPQRLHHLPQLACRGAARLVGHPRAARGGRPALVGSAAHLRGVEEPSQVLVKNLGSRGATASRRCRRRGESASPWAAGGGQELAWKAARSSSDVSAICAGEPGAWQPGKRSRPAGRAERTPCAAQRCAGALAARGSSSELRSELPSNRGNPTVLAFILRSISSANASNST